MRSRPFFAVTAVKREPKPIGAGSPNTNSNIHKQADTDQATPVAFSTAISTPKVTRSHPSISIRPPFITLDDLQTPESIRPVAADVGARRGIHLPVAARDELAVAPRWSHRARFIAALVIVTILGFLVRERTDVVRYAASKIRIGRAFAANKLFAARAESISDLPAPPCPAEMAFVVRENVRVCVDRYEASLVEIRDNGSEAPWSPYQAVGGHDVKAVSVRDAIPQGYISRDEAEVACVRAGKRLCTAPEWKTACKGPDKTVYPYGNTVNEDACNTHGKSPIGALYGSVDNERLWGDAKVLNDPSLNALDGTLAPAGSFAQCTNAFGVYDMVGNLHEWTADANGAFRGGYYLDTTQNGTGCDYATTAHVPSYHDYSTGFRCCRDAE